MSKCILLVVVLTACGHFLYGQTGDSNRIDSLKRSLRNATADSTRVDVLSDLLYEYMYTDAEEARRIAKQAVRIAIASQDSFLIIKSTDDYADMLYFQGSYDSSIQMFSKNLPIAKRLGFKNSYARILIALGNNYWRKGDYKKARQYQEQNLAFCEEINDVEGIAISYNNLGNICMDMGDYSSSIDFLTKAAKHSRDAGLDETQGAALANIALIKIDLEDFQSAKDYLYQAGKLFHKTNYQRGVSFVLKNQGIIHKKLKNLDSALYYYNASIVRYQEMDEKYEVGQLTNNIGNIYYERDELQKARAHFLKALAISEDISDSLGICANYSSLGQVAYKLKDNSTAKRYLHQASEMAQGISAPYVVIEAEKTLALIYRDEGDFRNAFKSEHAYTVLRDSLFDTEKQKLAKEIEAKFQVERSTSEINALKSENELKNNQIRNRERERYYWIAIAVITLILVAVLYNRYLIKNKAHSKLMELDKIKSRFFANISHEFRTPLTLIAGCLDDLGEGIDMHEDRLRLAVMQKNTRRLQQLIEQLLDLSRLENGKLKLMVRPMSPKSFLTAISSSFSSWAEQKKITLSLEMSGEGNSVYFDDDVLEKIVGNLLSNAIKFTQSEGKVSLIATWDADEMNLQVVDTGPGIPAEKLQHIFERFYQADDSPTRRQEGTGIGLALVKELASLHHGKVRANSSSGQGSTFVVKIPINKKYYTDAEIQGADGVMKKDARMANQYLTAESYPVAEERHADRSIVLVVEDNVDLSHFIGAHLPEHSIILAHDGMDGLNKAMEHVPDLIISDVMMPEMDGVELCRKVKEEEKTSHIPFILLTAKADIESRLEGLETGADDYMTKPFDARELQTRVKNLIAQRQALRERFSRTMILKPKQIAITSRDEIFLEKVMAIVEVNLSDSEFSIDNFQAELGMSRMQLHRKLKALTGHSAGEFMRTQRLIRASEMLSKTDSNVTEVCYQTGFTSVSYFSKCFKKQFGVLPKAFASKNPA